MPARAELSAFPLMACAALCACTSGQSSVLISEFLAANASGLTDVDGDTSDWIELHNRGKAAVNLEGWCITDSPGQPRWCFPSLSLPAGGFVVVFASGKRASASDPQLHASFKLKATHDYLGLISPSGAVVNEFAPYPDQKVDVSYGITRTGTHDFQRWPTPGAPNSEAL